MARDEIWDALHGHFKDKFDADRERFAQEADTSDDGKWTKHSKYHWSRQLGGQQLDFWPTRKKFRHNGRTRRGDMMKYIRDNTPKEKA
jgi:hypothetical protein